MTFNELIATLPGTGWPRRATEAFWELRNAHVDEVRYMGVELYREPFTVGSWLVDFHGLTEEQFNQRMEALNYDRQQFKDYCDDHGIKLVARKFGRNMQREREVLKGISPKQLREKEIDRRCGLFKRKDGDQQQNSSSGAVQNGAAKNDVSADNTLSGAAEPG
jgi:hypothetical protein